MTGTSAATAAGESPRLSRYFGKTSARRVSRGRGGSSVLTNGSFIPAEHAALRSDRQRLCASHGRTAKKQTFFFDAAQSFRDKVTRFDGSAMLERRWPGSGGSPQRPSQSEACAPNRSFWGRL